MGLFSKKQKITIDDMAMKMMLAGVEAIGKLTIFNEASETQNMIVGMGYFYGFLKINLNSITRLDTANAIIEKNKIENVSYDYIVKQLGEPLIKGNNYEEFYIKPECFCGLAYCALSVTFDEEKNIESIAIIHPN